MSFQTNLSALFASPNPVHQDLAQKIKNIDDAYVAKSITEEEAKDLLNDMKTEEALAALANDLQSKIFVQQTVDKLIFIISNIISI
jgi:hypothetical protein